MKEGNWFYRTCWWVALGLIRLLLRMRVEGASCVPASKGMILASNHVSYVDPPIVGVAARRELFYVTKREVFPVPVVGWLISQLNAIPIDRSRGDRAALQTYEGKLLQGKAVFIAPEGTRNKGRRFLRPKAGAGMLVYRTGVPVVPVFVSGTRNIWATLLGWASVKVRFGAPVYYDRSSLPASRREAYRAISIDIMERIESLKRAPSTVGTSPPASSR